MLRHWLLLLLTWGLAACQTLSPSADKADTHYLTSVELPAVPFFPDDTSLCGPSALAALILNAGIDASPDSLRPLVYLPGRQGALQLEMLAAPPRLGAVAYRAGTTVAALHEAVRNAYPVLVLMNLGLDFAPSWHYALVVGIVSDKGETNVLLRSGLQRRQEMPLKVFQRVWARSGNWAMLVSRPETLPSFLDPSVVKEGVVNFSRLAGPPHRIVALETALKRFPDDAVLGFSLASQLQEQGDLDRAQTLWTQLAKEGSDAAASANLAWLLHSRKQSADAVVWACRSVDNRGLAQLPTSLQERIRTTASRVLGDNAAVCR